MEYVINVAKRTDKYPLGVHVFRVVCDNGGQASRVYQLLSNCLPAGYLIDVSRRETYCQDCTNEFIDTP